MKCLCWVLAMWNGDMLNVQQMCAYIAFCGLHKQASHSWNRIHCRNLFCVCLADKLSCSHDELGDKHKGGQELQFCFIH